MNKHLYRIVFNHALRVYQVVSELVRRSGRGASVSGGVRTARVRPVSWSVWAAFGWIGFASMATAGQISGDPNAPGNQRPTVLGAPGAAPLINIQTPSAAGVSRNTYSQFDVDSNGAVLNNSRINTQTQLAGSIAGNPWLATGTAKIILNEVTGSSPSQLNGYVEVAGDRAQVIIANPAGIACNGCGFINANRVTLTTGTPLLSGGALDGYRVSGGAISVGGTGLDASRADYTDIITRALQVNAGIWAPQLQVTTGSNQVSADQAKITPISGNGSAPTFAVDVSALGGMYANKIQLVGTEHGVGVRNAGTIGAQAGELTITVDGRLENTGNLQSQTDTQVAASGGIANAGTISAANTLTINTPRDLDNSNGTLSAARLDVTADSLRNQGGTLTQTGTQAMTLQAGAVSNRDGGSIGVPAAANDGDTGNGGSAAGTDPNTAGNPSGGGGATDAGGGPTPSVTPLTPLPDGALHIASLLNNDGGHISANAGFDLDTASGLSNDGGQLELRQLTLTSGNLSNNGGTLAIDGMATIHANSVSNDAGLLTFNGPLNVDAQQLSNRAGTIQQWDSGATSLAVAGTLDNTDGTLASNAASLAVASGTLINQGGTISHAGLNGLSVSTDALYGVGGRIATAGAMRLTAGTVDHRSATLSATQVTIHAASFDNLGGTVTASGDAANTLTVTGTLDNGNGGTLASNGDLTLQANVLGNAGGTVQQAGNGALVIRAATLNGAGGMIGSNGSLTVTGDHTDLSGGTTVAKQIAITTGTLSTAGGQLDALGDDPLQLSVRGAFDNTGGSIIGNGALALSAASFTNTRGTLIAAGTGPTTLQVTSLFDNAGGTLASAGATTLHVGSLINAGGTLQASAGGSPEGTSSAAPLTLTVDGLLNNDQGSLQSNGDIALAAGSVSNHGGNVQTPGAIHATVAGTLDNSGAVIAGADLVVQADSLLNRNTLSNTATTGLYGQQVTLNAATLDNTQGAIVARDALTVSGNTLGNAGGVIDGQGAVTVTGLTLDNTGGQLTQHGDAGSLTITIAQALDNTGGGMIGAEGSAQLHAGRFDNSDGTIVAQHDLSLVSDGDLLNNNRGLLQTQGALTLNANGSFDNSAGQVDATGAATIAAASISNVAGQLLAGDVSTPDAALQITTGSLDNRGGTLGNRGGDIALSAASIDNSSAGTLVAQRDLSVNTNTFNNAGGTTFATRNLSYQNANATLDNTHGQFGAGDTAWLNLAQITNNNGHLQADTLWLTTPTLNNDGGEVDGTTVHATFASLSGIGRLYGADLLEAHITSDYTHLAGQRLESDGVLSLTVDDTLTNQGTLQTPGELDITAANIINTNGAVINASAADGSAVANLHASGSIDNQQGASLEGDTLALTANTLSNTGNITGDAIRIDAATLTNGRDLGTATAAVDYGEGFIGAAQTMDLHVGSLANLDGQLYSGGDLTIAADAAGHQAQSVLNSSGLIQAQGNLNIAAQQITNQRRVFEAEVVDLTPDEQAQNTQTEASVPRYRYDDPDPLHHPPYIDPSQVVSAQEIALADSWCASFNGSNDRCIGYPNGSGSATMFQSSTTDTVTSVTRLVSASAAGQLVSGGDISFGGAVLNDKSTLAAGGNLTVVDPGTGAFGAVQNIAWTPTATVQSVTDDQVQSQYLVHSPNRTWLDGIFYTYDTSSASTTLAMDGSQPAWITYDAGPGLPATVTGKTVTIVANVVTNGSASGITTDGLAGPGNTTLNNAGHAQAGSTAAARGAAAQTIGNADGPLPGYTPPTNAMVVQHTDPGAPFLVTTAPRFARGPVTSSNYLLQALGDDPANMHKRLGDGYYEQNLVLDQILQLTGRRSLNGSGDAMAQYTDLMNNAAQQASQLGLSLGAPLTSAQIGALTTDIVWLVDMVVDGQEVLTPVVYLSQATVNHLKANGALIAGDQVAIQSSTTLSNAGSINSDHGTWLSADTLINTGAGAVTALDGERYNRQLHPDETARLAQLKDGQSPEEQQRLTDAACALAHCADGVPNSDPAKAALLASQQRGHDYTDEQSQLQSTGLFNYSTWNATQDLSSRNQLGTRTLGGLQWVGGNLQAVGGVAAASTCETGVGCVAASYLFVSGADNANAGFQTMINGTATPTWGGQVLQSLGMSPGAAEFAYSMTQLGTMAGQGIALNLATNADIKASQMARSSYKDFVTGGLQASDEVMATPQAQALISEIQAGSPGLTYNQALNYAAGYIESGTGLPTAAVALPDSQLIKVVPNSILTSGAGNGAEVSSTSGYWMTVNQAKALQNMSPEQMGQVLGLPAGQAARIANDGFEFYMISPKPGLQPSIFVSEVAPSSQGTITMPGGAEQVIVPNRSQWTNPVQIDPSKL
jgi:filamentous hemagglutinin